MAEMDGVAIVYYFVFRTRYVRSVTGAGLESRMGGVDQMNKSGGEDNLEQLVLTDYRGIEILFDDLNGVVGSIHCVTSAKLID